MTEKLEIAPHGGTLIDREVRPKDRDEARARATRLPLVNLTARAASDLLLLATGAFSPLSGFMGYDASRSVVENLALPDGTLWPFPVLLQLHPSEAAAFSPGSRVALAYRGELLGTLQVEERFTVPGKEWAREVFKTAEEAHPGVAAFLASGEAALAGPIEWFGDASALELSDDRRTPAKTRAEIARRGSQAVAGFQTRNPIHRAHEYVLRTVLEVTDGLLLHPLVGETRPEDLPAHLRLRCYQVLLEHYFPQERILFSVLPAWMRYGGPREAVFHALVRKNFGCTHFIVGRNHAGVGSYYGPYDAQRIFERFRPDELGIQPLCFEHTFYCRRCGAMASPKTCPHDGDARVTLSGTRVRELLRSGELPPPEFSRPEVARALADGLKEVLA